MDNRYIVEVAKATDVASAAMLGALIAMQTRNGGLPFKAGGSEIEAATGLTAWQVRRSRATLEAAGLIDVSDGRGRNAFAYSVNVEKVKAIRDA